MKLNQVVLALLLMAVIPVAIAQDATTTIVVPMGKDSFFTLLQLLGYVVAFGDGWIARRYYTTHNLKGKSAAEIVEEVRTNSRASDAVQAVANPEQIAAWKNWITGVVKAEVDKLRNPS